MHTRWRPGRIWLPLVRFAILLVMYVALFVDYEVVSYNTQFGRSSVLFQSAALFFAVPAAYMSQSKGPPAPLPARGSTTRLPLDCARAGVAGWRTVFQDRRTAASESQAGISQVGMAALALLIVDIWFYFVAAAIWMTVLYYCIPLYYLNYNLIVFIATLTVISLAGTAFASVRIWIWPDTAPGYGCPNADPGQRKPFRAILSLVPRPLFPVARILQIITDFSGSARTALIHFLFFVLLTLPICGFFIRYPDMQAYTYVS